MEDPTEEYSAGEEQEQFPVRKVHLHSADTNPVMDSSTLWWTSSWSTGSSVR